TRQHWLDVNTNRMRPARGPFETTEGRRAVTLDGRPLLVYEHEDDLVRGFAAMYRFLAREGDALLAAGSPFDQFRHADVRFIYRSTSLYAVVLDRLRNADLLRDGADRSIEIEQLAVAALSGAKDDNRTG